MRKKKIFWMITAILVIILALLLYFSPSADADVLIFEDEKGKTEEVKLKEISLLKGINFEEIKNLQGDFDNETEYQISKLLKFYEQYKEDKGDNLLRVYYIDQVIKYSGIERFDYTKLTFQAVDGASVVIQPQGNKDSLILLALEKNHGNLSFRLIMPEDNFSQRWLKNVVKINIE